MNRWIQLVFVICAAVALIGTLTLRLHGCHQARAQEGQRLLEPVVVEGAAPGFQLPDLAGKTWTLADFKGQFVLVNFWATWCKPCRQELPHLAMLARQLDGHPIKVVLISVDEQAQDIARMAGEFVQASGSSNHGQVLKMAAAVVRGSLPNVVSLLDKSEQSAHRYGTQKYPETYLVGPDGELRMKFVGPKLWGQEKAVPYLVKMLQQKP